MEVVLKSESGEEGVLIPLEAKTFKSGTKGFYFRDWVTVDGQEYHVQVIISRK